VARDAEAAPDANTLPDSEAPDARADANAASADALVE
jgi:hypothetical protein